MMRFVFSIGVVLSCLTFAEGQVPTVLEFDHGSIHVRGLQLKNSTLALISDNEWMQILAVYTHEAWTKKVNQPISGTWHLSDDDLVFKPHFPFSPGETYHALFNARAFNSYVQGGNALTGEEFKLTFSLPKSDFLGTSIKAVYPESEVVPENLLRMYVYFSSPMMPGEAYDHIMLLRADGSIVEKPFLIVDQELWDAQRKRFTLLLDPGRIKRTLKSNLDLGAPLKEGEKYQLLIDSTWRDANGNHLKSGYRKEFIVAEPQRTKLSAAAAKVTVPGANSRDKVVISFDRPMDRVLMAKYVSVSHSFAGDINGLGEMIDDFTWTFTPDHEWASSKYEVTISPLVEDVCGNNFNNVFDLDLEKERRVNSSELVRFSFVVRAVAQ
jgi:hypothetical protein